MYQSTAPKYIKDTPTRSFTDIDLSFEKHPITNDIIKKTDIEAIKASVKNLILINYYEKPFHPYIGSNLYYSLFENIYAPGTKTRIKSILTKLINTYEPRAKVTQILIEDKSDLHGIVINVTFIPINNISPITVSQFLQITR